MLHFEERIFTESNIINLLIDSSDQRELRKQQSAIFKWERDKFVLYQSLYTLGAQSWEHFTIGSQVGTKKPKSITYW